MLPLAPPKATGLHPCHLTTSFPVALAYFRPDLIGWLESHGGSESLILEMSSKGGEGGVDEEGDQVSCTGQDRHSGKEKIRVTTLNSVGLLESEGLGA